MQYALADMDEAILSLEYNPRIFSSFLLLPSLELSDAQSL